MTATRETARETNRDAIIVESLFVSSSWILALRGDYETRECFVTESKRFSGVVGLQPATDVDADGGV